MKQYLKLLSQVVMVATATLLLLGAQHVFAHGEQLGSKKPAGDTGDTVKLSEAAKLNIGLKTVEVEMRAIEQVVSCSGVVKTEPNKIGIISSRADGRVVKFYANIGDHVVAGQKMVDIEARLIGNPPPVVSVTTPITGVVVHRDVELGEAIEPGKHIMHVMNLSRVNIECDVFESDISRITLGQMARVKLLAYPDREFMGNVTYIANTLDPDTRTIHVWVNIDNIENLLKPEMFATVAIVVNKGEGVLAIPKAALLKEAGETFVFIENGDAFNRQDIVTGASDDRYIEIKEGLVPGDRVVTDGKRQVFTKYLLGGD